MTDLRPLSAEVYDPEATSAIRVDPREADYYRPRIGNRMREAAEVLVVTGAAVLVFAAAVALTIYPS